MKRLLIAAIALALTPLTALAISLSEITDNQEQFHKITEDRDHILYMDTYSVESLRYSPPYYTMRGNFYLASYSRNELVGFTLTADYDYNRSMNTIVDKIAKYDAHNNINETKDSLYEKYRKEKSIDCGIRLSITDMKQWDLDGKFVGDLPPLYNEIPPSESNEQIMASHLFHQYYNEYF